MNVSKKIRALTDRSFRNSLDAARRAEVGAHPAGPVEIDAKVLDMVAGAQSTHTVGMPVGTFSGTCCAF